jgi:spoIIIJ-associated protein
MSDKNNLDSYLENLGISDADTKKAPAVPSTPQAIPIPARSSSGAAPSDTAPKERAGGLVASSDAIVEDFLTGMLVHVDPGFTVSARTRGDSVNAEILGGDAGKVIGREGRTLAAIEFLANTVLTKEMGAEAPRVSVDASGYRRRHEERLLEQARRAAARVRKSGEPFEMDAMSAADRRIIHIALREDAFVSTESLGEGAERRIVIKAK